MKAANSWTTYRTRFLVQARQLNSSLTFTDVLGRQHSGSKGDYLVESSDGLLRIAPRQIFEDIYVPLDSTLDEAQKPLHSTDAQKLSLSSRTPRKVSRLQPDPLAPSFASGRGPGNVLRMS